LRVANDKNVLQVFVLFGDALLTTGHRGFEARRGAPRRTGLSQRFLGGAVAVLV
jgi:hypothetical protein